MTPEPVPRAPSASALARFDESVDNAVMRLRRSLRPAMWFATVLGYPAVQAVPLVVLALASSGSLRLAFALVAASLVLPRVVKHLVGRRRPDSDYVAAMRMAGPSFPSGHAYAAVAAGGLYASLAIRGLAAAPAALAALGAVAWIAWVSTSRLFFRAHFASDIVGGWILGGVALAAVLIAVQP